MCSYERAVYYGAVSLHLTRSRASSECGKEGGGCVCAIGVVLRSRLVKPLYTEDARNEDEGQDASTI